MKNFIQPGDKITVPAPADVVSGAGTVIGGALFGVAMHDAKSGVNCTFVIDDAVVELPKLGTAVCAVGDKVHWDIDSSPPQLIKASAATGDILDVGIVVAAAGSGPTTVKIKLTPEAASVSA
jgi:predicted RecA/RadA family phage recombinase